MTQSKYEVTEINKIIAEIEKEIKPNFEIGARMNSPQTIVLLSENGYKNKPKFFKCERKYTQLIINYFVKEKGIKQNRFSMNNQNSIFIIEI